MGSQRKIMASIVTDYRRRILAIAARVVGHCYLFLSGYALSGAGNGAPSRILADTAQNVLSDFRNCQILGWRGVDRGRPGDCTPNSLRFYFVRHGIKGALADWLALLGGRGVLGMLAYLPATKRVVI